MKSFEKLKTVVENMYDCKFIVNLGDIINGSGNKNSDEASLNKINKLLQGVKVYNVIGNHDAFALDKKYFTERICETGDAYSFYEENMCFIVLDAGFYDDEMPYSSERSEWENTYISQKQLKWLESMLRKCKCAAVFCHQNIDARYKNGIYLIRIV